MGIHPRPLPHHQSGHFNEWELDDRRKIYLLTPAAFNALADGTKVISIFGEVKTKGVDHIDTDTRCGYLAWGVIPD